MTDAFDRAQELEELHRAESLRAALAQPERIGTSPFCVECGEEIPEARRLALPGVSLCLGCQTEQEAA